MAIDIKRETIVTMEEAAAWWSERSGRKRRGEQPLSSSTVRRWHFPGVLAADGSRVSLEIIHEGQRWKTSLEALQRLFAAVDEVAAEVRGRQVKRAERSRRKAKARGRDEAAAELEALGA